MLSVLIPTYNYNAVSLVKELHKQLLDLNILFEIICIDDGSKSVLNQFNQEINTLAFGSFIALKENIGRSAIRNYLSKKSSYQWMLFLDSDVLPTDSDFIQNYLKAIKNNSSVVFCGGIKYIETDENKKLLRYKYGINYEEIKLGKRKKQAYKFFFTSNFLISKEVFKRIRFEEKLKKYGREDLLFSLHLKVENYKIVHIKNEVYHLGLDDDVTFVLKTKQAMENIIFLEQQNFISNKEGNLLKIVNYINLFGFLNIVGRFSTYFEKKTIQYSSIFYLNCLKISYLCSLKQRYNE